MEDKYGNSLYMKGNTIFLQLRSEPRPRKIGVLYADEQTLEVERKSLRHIMRVNNSYGFNQAVLATATKYDKVRLIEDGKDIYVIPILEFKNKGTYLNFQQQGFELQVFLNLSIINLYKVC